MRSAAETDTSGIEQVCSLPPAWGYEHCGVERFLLSLPRASHEGGRRSTRLVKQEADPALLVKLKQREDRMAFLYSFWKLLQGLGVSCLLRR